jgi:hypothetical protein
MVVTVPCIGAAGEALGDLHDACAKPAMACRLYIGFVENI